MDCHTRAVHMSGPLQHDRDGYSTINEREISTISTVNHPWLVEELKRGSVTNGIALVGIVTTMFGALQATPSATPVSSPWANDFAEARSGVSGFQRVILADDQSSAEEYDLAVYAFLTCMDEEGYANTLGRDEILPWVPWYVQPGPDLVSATPGATPATMDESAYFSETDEVFNACNHLWKSRVEMLYQAIIVNRENIEWRC